MKTINESGQTRKLFKRVARKATAVTKQTRHVSQDSLTLTLSRLTVHNLFWAKNLIEFQQESSTWMCTGEMSPAFYMRAWYTLLCSLVKKSYGVCRDWGHYSYIHVVTGTLAGSNSAALFFVGRQICKEDSDPVPARRLATLNVFAFIASLIAETVFVTAKAATIVGKIHRIS